MSLEQLLSNPLILLALGFVLSEWRSGRAGQNKAIQVDANILARLENVEAWQRDHNSIHGCVQSLRATTEAMAKNVDRLTRRLDQWMSAFTTRAKPGSPYVFDGAREWALDAEEQ